MRYTAEFVEVRDLVDEVIAEIAARADAYARRKFEEEDNQMCLELHGGGHE